MQTGTLANLAGVNKETLRFYEREGLLRKPERTAGGYRAYAEADLKRLVFIKNAQRFGFSLTEIRELLALADGRVIDRSEVRHLAKRRVDQITNQLTLLNHLRTTLQQLIRRCSHTRVMERCPIIESLSVVTTKKSGRKKHQ